MTTTSSPLLLCAATRWEAEPLAAALGLNRVSPLRWEGLRGEREIVLVQTGVGPVNTGERLLELSNEEFGLALSVGFAGALQPKMASGDLVFDLRGADAELPPTARELAAAKGFSIHFGKIVHSDRVLSTPAQKKALGIAERAGAVDMETQALRTWAEERELPVLALRVVLDSLEDSLPAEVPAGEDFGSLLRYAAKNWRSLPNLMSTGLKQRRAIAHLAAYLEEILPKL